MSHTTTTSSNRSPSFAFSSGFSTDKHRNRRYTQSLHRCHSKVLPIMTLFYLTFFLPHATRVLPIQSNSLLLLYPVDLMNSVQVFIGFGPVFVCFHILSVAKYFS